MAEKPELSIVEVAGILRARRAYFERINRQYAAHAREGSLAGDDPVDLFANEFQEKTTRQQTVEIIADRLVANDRSVPLISVEEMATIFRPFARRVAGMTKPFSASPQQGAVIMLASWIDAIEIERQELERRIGDPYENLWRFVRTAQTLACDSGVPVTVLAECMENMNTMAHVYPDTCGVEGVFRRAYTPVEHQAALETMLADNSLESEALASRFILEPELKMLEHLGLSDDERAARAETLRRSFAVKLPILLIWGRERTNDIARFSQRETERIWGAVN